MAYDLQSFELFRSVVAAGSIAAAAARHGIAASAVSKRISDLEKALGVTLLTRHRRGIEVTPAGKVVMKHAAALDDRIARLETELRDEAHGSGGTIRIAANTSAITQFLPEDLAEFMLANPEMTIRMAEMESVEILDAVRSGAVEIGIFSGFTEARGLKVLPYRRDTLVVCAPRGHPLAARRVLRLKDLDGEKFVALQRRSSLQAHVDRCAAEIGVNIRTAVEVKSFDGVRRMVQARLGVAILPFGAVEAYLGDGSIAMIPIDEPWATRDLLIAVRDRAALSPSAEALLKTLQGQPRAPGAG
jgi:DNA-binding transcriptional LysR family regulator